MASELFHDLHDKAFRLDCAIIHKLNELANPKGMFFPFATSRMLPLVEDLLGGWSDFKAKLHRVALTHRMYKRKFKERCPHCGQADCPGAVPLIEIQHGSPGAMLSYLLDYPPDDGK